MLKRTEPPVEGLKERVNEREKIETLMLWDLMFLRKSALFTEIDMKSLGKFSCSLRRPKRTSKPFVFSREKGCIPEPIEPNENIFSQCEILSERDAKVSKLVRSLKMRNSHKAMDRHVALQNQRNVLQMRNLLYHFFRTHLPDPPEKSSLQIELKTSKNDRLILKPMTSAEERDQPRENLLDRVRVTHIDNHLRALVTMRKQNFHNIFESINRIRRRIQKNHAKSKMLIENQRSLLKEEDSEDLLKDMIGWSGQEKQYLIYKEKKQKMRKLRDVKVYRQVFGRFGGFGAGGGSLGNLQTPDAETELSKLQPNDSICQVCTSGDYSDSNQIVFCSKCNVSVHQLCYGLSQVPEGDWICQVCLVFGPKGKYLDCALCSCKGGAMKRVNVMVFDDFIKENLPIYWARQHRKINRFKHKLQFDLQIEQGPNSTNNTQMEPIPSELVPNRDALVPQAMKVIGQSEVDIIRRIMDTYDWKLETSQGIFYDYYKERFNFSPEELTENEPVSMKCWIHLSCALWMPEMFLRDLTTVKATKGPKNKQRKAPKVRRRKERLVEVAAKQKPAIRLEEVKNYLSGLNMNKYQLTGLKDVSKSSLHWQCQACKMVEGATLKCYSAECTQKFHVECAKRAGLTIEAQTSEHKDFILFCEAHTPLKFKKEIQIMRKRSRNEIVKFAKNLKKKLKDVLSRETMTMLAKANEEEEIVQESSQSAQDRPTCAFKAKRGKREKKKLKRKKEKKEKFSMEEKIEGLGEEKKKLLLEIKNELQASKDFFFVWDVNLGEKPQGEGIIHESLRVSHPSKSIFRNKISKSNRIWKSLAKKHMKSGRSLYERHLSIINSLKVEKEIC